jgi:hypothetical protein
MRLSLGRDIIWYRNPRQQCQQRRHHHYLDESEAGPGPFSAQADWLTLFGARFTRCLQLIGDSQNF